MNTELTAGQPTRETAASVIYTKAKIVASAVKDLESLSAKLDPIALPPTPTPETSNKEVRMELPDYFQSLWSILAEIEGGINRIADTIRRVEI